MQIQSSPSAMIHAMRPAQRPATSAGAALSPGKADQAVQGGPAQQQIDVARILQHWGTSNAEADLNVDGIVDAQDLAIASAQQNSGTAAITSEWGRPGANDLNGDGVVDATDLAMSLNGEPSAPPTREAVIGNLVEAAFNARDKDADGAISASDFADNGRVFRRLDIDTNGRVGREEMAKALSVQFDRFASRFPEAKPSAFAKRWMEAFEGTRPAPELGHFARVQELFAKGPAATRGTGILSARA